MTELNPQAEIVVPKGVQKARVAFLRDFAKRIARPVGSSSATTTTN